MALTYTSAIAALLNNGNGNQVLPISMANLIELSKDKQNFGTSAQSVQDALSYLAGSFKHADDAAKAAQDNAYAYVNQEIGKLDVDAVGSTDKDAHNKYISYIWEKDGKIEAFAKDMTAANVAYAGGDSRATVADELQHINSTIADNLTATTLKLVNAEGIEVKNKTVTADGSTYKLKQGDKEVAIFNIEKDSFVKSGAVVRCKIDSDGNITGSDSDGNITEDYKGEDGAYFIKLVIKTHDAATDSPAENILYIPAESLVDAYKAKNDGNNVTIAIDQNKNTISAVIKAGGVGTNELAANAVTTAKIADGNVTKTKLSDEVQTSLGKANSSVQSITTGEEAGTIAVDGTDVKVKDIKAIATTGAAKDVTVATIADLDTMAGESVTNVQTALAKLTGKVKAINDGGVVTSVKTNVVDSGKDTQNAVAISMTPVAESKGAVTVELTHNLGSAAALDYDMKAVATPVSEDFWNLVK